uniref:Piwi domain-containing protein n=2 Tax=Meloidogyne incognita group TaxID=654580 RepID=A0A915NCM2_MELJA
MPADLSQVVNTIRAAANIPPQATQFIKNNEGLANIYTFDVKPGVVMVYRYDVELSDKVKNKSLTKGGGDDGKKGLLRDICFELVTHVFENTQGFGSNGKVLFVYDNRKILFTNCRVPALTCEITPDRMSEFCRKFLYNATITFELQPCKGSSHELNLNDIPSALCPAPHIQADHSLRTFFEMLTSQSFINARSHRLVGPGRLFEERVAKRLNDAITAHNGVAKGVRIIVNGDVKPCPALVADGNLGDIARGMVQSAMNRRRNPLRTNDRKAMESFWLDFGHLFKGVSAYLTYAPSRVIVIDSITARLVSEISFEVDGRNIPMMQYFAEKKNVRIEGNMPAVRQHVDRDALYPLQCLEILPFQRVSIDKMQLTDEMAQISSDLLKANAVGPDVRSEMIKDVMRQIGRDGDCAKFMFHFGVKLRGDQNNVQIGQRNLPVIKFGNNQTANPNENEKGSFEVRGPLRYLEPSEVLRSWIVAFPRRVTQDSFNKFIGDIQRMANQRGMKLPQPVFENLEVNAMEQRFAEFSKAKIQFVLYIDERFVKSHAKLKLCERRYTVLTQHVNIEMVSKAGPASVSNVLAKMNMKLFGLNYMPIFDPVTKNKLDIASGQILVLGIDTSRPPRATAFEKFKLSKQGMEGFTSEDPLTIGYCGNYLANPSKFVGDYLYQPCKQDVLDVDYFGERIKWIVSTLKANRKQLPSTIFIIRDGISEGMVPKAVNGEFSRIIETFRSINQGWIPKFVFVIVDKRHTKRFFLNTGPNRNPKPGSVIDKKFVRVDLHEFFLQAHHPLKGTSKIPQYMIPINEIKANNDELQAFIIGLCNMWQIVNMPPALPSPVLQAKELAKRGSNNYVEMKRTAPQYIPRITGERMIDFAMLNTRVPYGDSVLSKTRFNA